MTQHSYSGPIAGVSHAKPDFDMLAVGDELTLVLEPHNAYDPCAVRVHHNGAGKLGYIPAESTIVYHDALRNEFKTEAKILSLDGSGKWQKISMALVVH